MNDDEKVMPIKVVYDSFLELGLISGPELDFKIMVEKRGYKIKGYVPDGSASVVDALRCSDAFDLKQKLKEEANKSSGQR